MNIIKSITLDIDGKEIEVTPDQAYELHSALGELLGLPKEKLVGKYVPVYPVPTYPSLPITPYWYYNGNRVTTDETTISYTANTENCVVKL